MNPPATRPAGVQHRILHSKAMKRDVGYNIYLPPDYESSGRRYPVIYWLHGSGGNESSSLWIAEEYQKAIAFGRRRARADRLPERRPQDGVSRLAAAERAAGNDDHPRTDSAHR